MKGVSILAAVIAIAVIIVMGFFAAIFILSTSYERTLSDRVASAHTAINLFYAYNETLPVFAQLLILTAARDLGENCGGVNCGKQCVWNLSCPTLEQLVDKYNSSIITIFDSLPKNVGELGRINFTPPKIEKISLTENCINLTLKPQSVWMNRSGFFLNASSVEEMNFSVPVRYYLLLTIGRMLFEKGEYKITNSALSKTIRFADESEPECSSVADVTVTIKNGKVSMPVDNFTYWAVLCGINYSGDVVHGLASLNDFYGEYSESSHWQKVTCTKEEALKDTDYDDIEATVDEVMDKLKDILTEFYNDANPNLPGTCEYEVYPGYKGINFTITTSIDKSYDIDTNQPSPETRNCSDYSGYDWMCIDCKKKDHKNCVKLSNSVHYYCSFEKECGDCGCGDNSYKYLNRTIDIYDKWGRGYFSHKFYHYSKTKGCIEAGGCDCGVTSCGEDNSYKCKGTNGTDECECSISCFCSETSEGCKCSISYNPATDCTLPDCEVYDSCTCKCKYTKTLYKRASSYSETKRWECKYSAYFVFDVTTKLEFEFTDNSILIPQRGSTAFEKLKLKLNAETKYHLSSSS